MDENSKNIINKFHEIANKGWIESISNNWGSIGLTFEKEIGKKPDSSYTPDYNDIEIKCTGRYSRYPIYLFTIAFDGPSDNEITRITDTYGYRDKDFPDKKVLFERINNIISTKNGYYFKIEIDYLKKILYFCIYDLEHVLIEKTSYITFESLEEHINTKLTKIAIVHASVKKNSKKYFRYYNLALYKIKDFETFLKLIDNNILDINIISRISKSGSSKGRYHNKNIIFSISKNNLKELFSCYYYFNYDTMY